VIETINRRGRMLMNGLGEILGEYDIPHVVTGVPSMFSLFLGSDEEPHDFRDYLKGDADLYEKIMVELIKRGAMPDSDGREPWFLCYSLSEADVSETLNMFNDAVKAVI
jgi:glutamate-1-semialdehyde aminotransferase